MRKQIIVPLGDASCVQPTEGWLDLESVAEFELTSEDPEHPIESALVAESDSPGWRASNPGEQMIRVCFAEPQSLKRIHLVFEEEKDHRTQEFVLRWSPSGMTEDYREIVRQQYNFSPPDTTRETEDYAVNLPGVKAFDLSIVPDISGDGFASLAKLQLA
jgi:hypothetical protein